MAALIWRRRMMVIVVMHRIAIVIGLLSLPRLTPMSEGAMILKPWRKIGFMTLILALRLVLLMFLRLSVHIPLAYTSGTVRECRRLNRISMLNIIFLLLNRRKVGTTVLLAKLFTNELRLALLLLTCTTRSRTEIISIPTSRRLKLTSATCVLRSPKLFVLLFLIPPLV